MNTVEKIVFVPTTEQDVKDGFSEIQYMYNKPVQGAEANPDAWIPDTLKDVLIEMKEDGATKSLYIGMAVRLYSDLDWYDDATAWGVIKWFDRLK